MTKKKIGVIGGGAAGLMAAITAARRGAFVTILESGDRLGRKILSTGNGKCNLGNLLLNAEQYHGADRRYIQKCLERFGTQETLDFFREIGILTKEKNGYLYPLCEQASAVLDALRYEVKALDIRVLYDFYVEEIRRSAGGKGGFCVRGKVGQENFDSVILASGGKAAPQTGSDGKGFELARSLGHRIVPVVPALTALKCREDFFKGIAGVRTQAEIALLGKDGSVLTTERGELQITDYGISGIPVFQLSRTVAYLLENSEEIPVRIDLLPDLTQEELGTFFQKRRRYCQSQAVERTVEEFFGGLLNKKLMTLLLKQASLKGNLCLSQISEQQLLKVLSICKNFRVTVTGTGSFQNAQVCAGGVDTAQITEDMESKLVKGLYFAGEVMDVDGRCGGYNLQWAWTSGYLAGRAAAGENRVEIPPKGKAAGMKTASGNKFDAV